MALGLRFLALGGRRIRIVYAIVAVVVVVTLTLLVVWDYGPRPAGILASQPGYSARPAPAP